MRALVLVCLLSTPAAAWEEVGRQSGIVAERLEMSGRDLPIFRGRGEISASIYEVLAVVVDDSRRTEWLHKCLEARVIERISDREKIIYTRTDAPWPVDDRDVVMRGTVEVEEPGKVIITHFKGVRDRRVPVPEDTVRMKSLRGYYRLTALDAGRTHVEYVVDADPGGWLPDWLVSRASRELPLKTLLNLRRQVRRTRGRYEAFLDRWDPSRAPPDQGPPVPPSALSAPAP